MVSLSEPTTETMKDESYNWQDSHHNPRPRRPIKPSTILVIAIILVYNAPF